MSLSGVEKKKLLNGNSKDIFLTNPLRFRPLRIGCLITFKKIVHETEKKEVVDKEFLNINKKEFLKKTGFFNINIRGKYFFDVVRNKFQAINIYLS